MSQLLIGREEELQALELFLVAARREPRAMVIEGEAGIGKTSLWQAGVESAERAGAAVLRCRPVEAEASFAYAALGDLLRDERAEVEALPAQQRHALEAALDFGDGGGEAPDGKGVALGAHALVERLAAERAVVLAVDDVQWLDGPSASAIGFVARRLARGRVGVLLSWRTRGGEPVPLELEHSALQDRIERLSVRPLSLGAVQRLLQERLCELPPRPVLRRLHELSAGNPFFALELGRALEAGTLVLEPGERLPVALEQLVEARIGALGVGTGRALAAAAALTQPTLALVEEVTGGGPGALDEAERADVVTVAAGRIRFTHPLLASGAYAAIGPSERRELHERAGACVSDPEERARHLALAARGPDERVAAALEDAAERADSRGAPSAAAELYESAQRLTPPGAEADALRRKLNAGFCTFRSGDGRRGRQMLDEVVQALGPGPDRARALISLARVRSYDDDLRAAEALFRQALDEAGGEEELRAAAGENLAAILFRLRERLHEAAEHASAAAAAARKAGSDGWLAEALSAQLLAEGALGSAQAGATLDAALALQEHCEHRRTMAQPLFQAGVVWLWWDELERATDAFERLARRAREMGDEASLPYILVMAAQVDAVRGDLALAADHADAGYELAEHIGQATVAAYLLALRAVVDADAGDAEAARDHAARALEGAGATSGRPAEHFAIAALGRLELSLGNAAEAARVLGPLVEFIQREEIREPGTARVVPDHVESLVALGELDAASDLLDWYAANAVALDRPSALAAASRCRGLLHAERGDMDRALAELEQAVEISARVPIPLERGRTLLVHGALQRRARRKRPAREALEAARAVLRGMGATGWDARVEAELARIGGRAPASGDLTPTERRVAELVAEGLQTKQVAAALFVSTKTVEGHLTNIYAKLGVHSRTELARRLTPSA